MGSLGKQTDQERHHTDTANIAMLRLALIASLAAAVSAMPAADPQMVMYYPGMTAGYVQQPQVTAYVQQPQVTVQAAEPKFKPTTYVAQPAAEPFFFNNMGRYGGMGWLGSNNMGGKADYGNYGERRYPSYGDYYRTHRYPINDGWMLWDEDLRDKDTAKADKFGSGKKDGGR